jgi:hypothetical protein
VNRGCSLNGAPAGQDAIEFWLRLASVFERNADEPRYIERQGIAGALPQEADLNHALVGVVGAKLVRRRKPLFFSAHTLAPQEPHCRNLAVTSWTIFENPAWPSSTTSRIDAGTGQSRF